MPPLAGHRNPRIRRSVLNQLFSILRDGAQRLLPLITETLREVRERVGLT
jgi:hypothetical protein